MTNRAVDRLLRRLRVLSAGHDAEGQADQQLLGRFVRGRDEAAFAVLMERHGPMVLGVCRRVLHDEHLAEDVLQATFLVLARNASVIRSRPSVGSWLHGVALRLAQRARAEAARTGRGDARPGPEAPPGPMAEASWREVRQILDEELQRLPESYRLPLVLCYLEGRTRDEAAAQLGWTLGRLKGLPERGRERLRGTLIRRGLAPAAAGAALLAETALAAPVPPLLAVAMLRAALRLAAGESLRVGALSGTVIGLAEGGSGIMGSKKLALVGVLALGLGVLGTAAGLLAQHAGLMASAADAIEGRPHGAAAPARQAPGAGRQTGGRRQGDRGPLAAGTDSGQRRDRGNELERKQMKARWHVTAVPDKSEILMGEPTYVAFKVANGSDRNLRVMVGGDYRNRLGRPESFKVEVVGADGKKVPQPDAGFGMGGIMSAQKLPAKGEIGLRLFLPDWAVFEKPGRYTMTIRRKLTFVADDGTDPFARKPDAIAVMARATITVVPADPARLGKIIVSLGDKMLDRGNSDEAEPAQKMLAAIHDERVVPYFAALAEKPHSSPRFAACAPLGRYRTDPAFEALKKLAATTGADIRASATTLELAESSADGVRHSAAAAIADSPHPKALPFLWTLADDRYYGVRLTVLHKAAETRTPEARSVIQKMTSDANETVRDEALRYLKKLVQEQAR
jgi:RNA polymerase sigma factor (sigma-70 family)